MPPVDAFDLAAEAELDATLDVTTDRMEMGGRGLGGASEESLRDPRPLIGWVALAADHNSVPVRIRLAKRLGGAAGTEHHGSVLHQNAGHRPPARVP
jgi:hypothetical protein